MFILVHEKLDREVEFDILHGAYSIKIRLNSFAPKYLNFSMVLLFAFMLWVDINWIQLTQTVSTDGIFERNREFI